MKYFKICAFLIVLVSLTSCPISGPGLDDETEIETPDDETVVDPVGQTVWYVVAGSANGTGRSWTSAYGHPQSAMDAASAGDIIKVAKGVYEPRSIGNERLPVLNMKNGVEIYGGYPVGGGTDLERDFDTNETKLIAAVEELW